MRPTLAPSYQNGHRLDAGFLRTRLPKSIMPYVVPAAAMHHFCNDAPARQDEDAVDYNSCEND